MKEFSCGIVLFSETNGIREYVLIMEPSGSYGFPKGHRRRGETEIDCALRECREETGIVPEVLPNLKRTVKYVIPNNNNLKEVIYFAGIYDGNMDLMPEDSNIQSCKKYTLEQALSLIKFQQIKDILVEMDYMLDLRKED